MLKMTEVNNYLLTPEQRHCIESALIQFCNFESIAKHLQTKGLMLNGARFVLDNVCDDYSKIFKSFAVDLYIVHGCSFENTAIKLMEGNVSQLAATERTSVKALDLESKCQINDNDSVSFSYVE